MGEIPLGWKHSMAPREDFSGLKMVLGGTL